MPNLNKIPMRLVLVDAQGNAHTVVNDIEDVNLDASEIYHSQGDCIGAGDLMRDVCITVRQVAVVK